MRSTALVLVFLLALTSLASGVVFRVSFPDRVTRSDAAVVGTLTEANIVVRNGVVTAEGVIRVGRVVFGSVDASRAIPLSWQNEVGIVCPRVDHQGLMGMRILWLLTEDGGSYQAGGQYAIQLWDRHGTNMLAEEIANFPGYLCDERLSAVYKFLKVDGSADDDGNQKLETASEEGGWPPSLAN